MLITEHIYYLAYGNTQQNISCIQMLGIQIPYVSN